MKLKSLIFALMLLCVQLCHAQSGVLKPVGINENGPNGPVLKLENMEIDVQIINQHAKVRIVQIFRNTTATTLEGKYTFALPASTSIFDFATWDGTQRLPGLIFEKRRADRVYAQIKSPVLDPAILRQESDAGGFSVKVYPISAFGTKRIELEYEETLAVIGGVSRFSFPLRPTQEARQPINQLTIRVQISSDFAFNITESSGCSLETTLRNSNRFEGLFAKKNFEPEADFSIAYTLDSVDRSLSFSTYRLPEVVSAFDVRNENREVTDKRGYFAAAAFFPLRTDDVSSPKLYTIMLDTSLSMRGDKLRTGFDAVEALLSEMRSIDTFNLLLFSETVVPFSPVPVAATPDNTQAAIDFVRAESLGGGTDILAALSSGIQFTQNAERADSKLVIISDANPTVSTTQSKRLLELATESKIAIHLLGIGTDSKMELIKSLSSDTGGSYAVLRETDDNSLHLESVLQNIRMPKRDGFRFDTLGSNVFTEVFQAETIASSDMTAMFVGRYEPGENARIAVRGLPGVETEAEVALPETNSANSHLPRIWAKAKIASIQREIDFKGESREKIQEIIRLSMKYKVLSPYTAFLAAPRSLLRPRLIQPGDPVIRLKTDPSVTSVWAVLPFGETLPLRFIPAEGVWETRFIAPLNIEEGVHWCRIILIDRDGNSFQEQKSFVVDSKVPKPAIRLEKRVFRSGETIEVHVDSDRDTAKIVARFFGAKPVRLFWSDEKRTSVGFIKIPEGLASGLYELSVSAEDFARNVGMAKVRVEIP